MSLRTVKEANKRLAIIGLFRLGDDQARWQFAKDGRLPQPVKDLNPAHWEDDKDKIRRPPVFSLGAESLFSVLQPELRLLPEKTLHIGEFPYNMNSLSTPADAKASASKSFPLLKDSLLLNFKSGTGSEPAAVIRSKGGEYARDLTKHLDVLAMMSHPNFMRALTWILLQRVPFDAHELSEQGEDSNTINYPSLQNLLKNDLLLRDASVNLLMCPRDDEDRVKDELRTRLSVAQTSAFSSDPAVKVAQIHKVILAISNLKVALVANDAGLRAKLVADKALWIENLSLAPGTKANDFADALDFSFNGKRLEPQGRDFIKLFRVVTDSSDWVSRFMRDPISHSFVFCWLAGKYADHTLTNLSPAADAMARWGVKEQNPRQLSESGAKLDRRLEIVQQRYNNAIKNGPSELVAHLHGVLERIQRNFIPTFSYNRSAHMDTTRDLFVFCCEKTGGIVSQLEDTSVKLNHEQMEIYQPLLRLVSDLRKKLRETNDKATEDDVVINVPQAKAELSQAATTDGAKALINTIFDESSTQLTGAQLKDRFYASFSDRLFRDFSDSYNSSKAEIDKQRNELKRLFDLWMNVAVESKAQTPGQPMMVVSAETLHLDYRPTNIERQAETLKTAVMNSMAAPKRTPSAILASVDAAPTTDHPVELTLKYGTQTAASIKLSPDPSNPKKKNAFMQVEQNPGFALNSGERLDVKQMQIEGPVLNGAPTVYRVEDLDELDPSALVMPDMAQTNKDVTNYDKLAKRLQQIQEKYAKGAIEDGDFHRAVRALQLGRIVLAVPRDQVNLDTRDLSNSTGVMMEIVRHFADEKTPQTFDTDALQRNGIVASGQQKSWAQLRNVNLSKFFPFEDDDLDVTGIGTNRMSDVLQYYYKLCSQLSNVQPYITELCELRDVFDAVALSDIAIDVVNAKISDYFAAPIAADLCLHRPPLLIYATHQAVVDSVALATMSDSLQNAATDTNAKDFQLPLVVVPPGKAATMAATCFPLIALDTINRPSFEDGAIQLDRRIEGDPKLMVCIALLSSSADLGRPAIPGPQVTAKLRMKRLPPWDVGALDVRGYLRSLWEQSDAHGQKVMHQVQILKWVNYAIDSGLFRSRERTMQESLRNLYGNNPQSVQEHGGVKRLIRDEVFDGLPFSFSREPTQLRAKDLNTDLSSYSETACIVPGVQFEIDGTLVLSPWLGILGKDTVTESK